jgi:hypothetical protein
MARRSARRDVDPEINSGRVTETPFSLMFRRATVMPETAARPGPACDMKQGATPGAWRGCR